MPIASQDTQVDRDDLADQGAEHVAATVRQLKQRPDDGVHQVKQFHVFPMQFPDDGLWLLIEIDWNISFVMAAKANEDRSSCN